MYTLAGGLTHELSQPLSGIRGYAEGLLIGLEEGLPISQDEIMRSLETIIGQVERIDRLLMQVRNYSDQDQRNTARACNIADIIDDSLTTVRAQFAARQLVVEWEPPEETILIYTSPHDLSEVIQHILNNAADAVLAREHTTSAQRCIHIVVEPHSHSGGPQIIISDGGIGMEPSILKRACEPFYTTKSPQHGVGLGLAICTSLLHQQKLNSPSTAHITKARARQLFSSNR